MSTETAAPDTPDDTDTVALVPLIEPSGGVPHVVETERELSRAAAAIAAGEGPVGIDAERASGYRYGQRAYLVQVRREGAGTWLIDPDGLPDLTPLNEAIGAAEWILHAATQDLACLAEVGVRPVRLFDTELAGRSCGFPGRAGPAGRANAGPGAAQGASRGGLVHPAVAARMAGLRGTGRRSAGGPAGRDGAGAEPAGQARVGP